MKPTTLAIALIARSLFAQTPVNKPETVMVTYHAKPGSEEDLARVLARQWDAMRGLNLVLAAPHTLIRGTEEGDKSYFVEILTWRDESIPDHAPPAIQALWTEMNKLVERRNGRPGIDFTEVAVVGP